MRRRLFNIAAALSLVGCFAICVVWVLSFYVIENRTIITPAATYQIGSGGGALAVQRVEAGDGSVRWMRPRARFSILGVEMIEGRLNRRSPWILLLMPYWVPAGVLAVLPMLWILARARREANAAQRRCPSCGHDRDPDDVCAACGFANGDAAGSAKPQAAQLQHATIIAREFAASPPSFDPPARPDVPPARAGR